MSADAMDRMLERATIAQERASAEYAEGLKRYAADRRERIATAALQGMLASVEGFVAPADWAGFVAQRAVVYADALMAELDKKEPQQ